MLKPDGLINTRSHYPERASALDFKEAAALQCGHSDVFFLSMFSKEHQKTLPQIILVQ